jgi:hypothetical protein
MRLNTDRQYSRKTIDNNKTNLLDKVVQYTFVLASSYAKDNLILYCNVKIFKKKLNR